MADSIRSKLPKNYAHLPGPLFDRPAIVETRATCEDCAMCSAAGQRGVELPGDEYFDPALKCCTYHPLITNFLIGGLLADPSPELDEGKRRIREKIASRIGITPRGVAPPRMQRVIYNAARERGFGRAPSLLCPYLAEGRCTVWYYREAVCSTYYCKHVGGAKGRAFWTAMRTYLQFIEGTLGWWAARQVHPGAKEPEIGNFELSLDDLANRGPNDAEYTSYWGDWVGREEEFFIACHEKVKALTPADFTRMIDESQQGKGLLPELQSRLDAAASPQPTPFLVLNPSLRKHKLDLGVAVRTYSPYDPMFITNDLYELLEKFGNTEPAAATLQRLGVELPPELVRDLWLHEILVPPSNDCRPATKLSFAGDRCVPITRPVPESESANEAAQAEQAAKPDEAPAR